MKSKTSGIAVVTVGLAALLAAPAFAAEIVGSPRADRLEGTAGRDSVDALAGADSVWTYRNDDFAQGKQGRDRLHLGVGNDRACGGAGDDRMVGGPGNDRLVGGICPRGFDWDGFDVVFGGKGRDYLEGTRQYGGDGADSHIVGGSRPVKILAGRGNDLIYNQFGKPGGRRDVLRCGPGRDTVEYAFKRDKADVRVSCEEIIVWID